MRVIDVPNDQNGRYFVINRESLMEQKINYNIVAGFLRRCGLPQLSVVWIIFSSMHQVCSLPADPVIVSALATPEVRALANFVLGSPQLLLGRSLGDIESCSTSFLSIYFLR